MHAANISRVTTTCSRCGSLNELTASDIPEGQEIYCSKCGSMLGKWRDLREAETSEGKTPQKERPSAA